jgi:hypothetical protein
MIKWLRTVAPLLALCLAGCVPFVLESGTANFAASEYSFPLADGNYAIDQMSPKKPAVVANRPDHVEITMFEKENTHTLIGGFFALKTPGHFIFQATNAMENGKPTSKKPGESVYIPLRIAATGEVSWYIGPKHCDLTCAALLSSHGFRQDNPAGLWNQPKNLPREQMLSFYEELAAMLEHNPEAWESVPAVRVAGL